MFHMELCKKLFGSRKESPKKIQVGYTCTVPMPDILTFDLERVKVKADFPESEMAKCPAVADRFRNVYAMRSPFDFEFSLVSGVPLLNPDSVVDPGYFMSHVIHTPEMSRSLNLPIVQISMGLGFISDTPDVEILTSPPIFHYKTWPGLFISGRYNIYDWPGRVLNFAFEWHDHSQKLKIKRGDVLCYAEFRHPTIPTIEAKRCLFTSDVAFISSQVNTTSKIISGTRCIMKTMGTRRPKSLLAWPEPNR